MYNEQRRNMVEIGKLSFAKGYTETCGSSITVRVDDNHYIQSPSGVAHIRWNVTEQEMAVVDKNWEVVEGKVPLPADAIIHLDILEEFPEVGACLHVHGKHSLVFACAGESIPAVTEQVFSLGAVPCIPEIPWVKEFHLKREYPSSFVNRPDILWRSEVVSEAVREVFREHSQKLNRRGMGILLPKHGIILAARTLDDCYDLLERIEHNAFVVLTSRMSGMTPLFLV